MAEDQPIEISEELREKLGNLALSEDDYRKIVTMLDREPNDLELGLFGSMWSEHCSYGHSKRLLERSFGSLPRPPYVLVGPGEGNAGVIDLGLASKWLKDKERQEQEEKPS
ncbi:hypothetical protein IIA94_00700 [Patescibacteria group bacterium]|nr:hypothetical protein [Patescibacteria group bacterium]